MRRSLQLAACSVLLGFMVAAPASAQVRRDPRQAWVFDDAVDESRREGNRLFVGGSFRTASPQVNGSRGFAELTVNSATPTRPFPRLSDGRLLALADDGGGGWFAGGTFTAVEGAARPFLAHYAASGALDGFVPSPNGPVRALLRVGSTLYVAGDFTSIAGAPRGRAAAFTLGTGALTAWDPQVADGSVHALATDGSRIFLGGDFTSVRGAGRTDLAAVDGSTGVPDGFSAATDGTVRALLAVGGRLMVGGSFNSLAAAGRANFGAVSPSTGAADPLNVPVNGPVLALTAGPGGIYLGGAFTTVAGQPRGSLAALDDSGALRAWVANVNGTVQALGLTPGGIIAGGAFTRLNGETRANIAAVAPSGALLAWNPGLNGEVDVVVGMSDGRVAAGGVFTHFGARVREGLAALDVVTDELLPLAPALNGAVTAMAISGRALYVGGTFTQADGAPRNRLAAFDTTSYALLPWNPDVNDTVEALEVAGATVFAGGRFTTVGGGSRPGLVGLDATTGAPTAFNAGFGGTTVNELELAGSTLYVGGAFTQLGGQPRANLGALDLGTGAVTALAPNVGGGAVWGLSVTPARLYFSGEFTSVNGQPRQAMAAVDRATGALTGFDPVVVPAAPASAVYDIDVHGTLAYIAGRFNDMNCCTRHGFAVIESNEGRSTEDSHTDWPAPLPPADTVGRHITYYGDLLVAGGLVPPAGPDRQQGLYLIADFSSAGAPGPPSMPVARIIGDALQLTWTPSPIGGNYSDFVVEAALAPGAPAFASIPNGSGNPSFSIAGVPPGIYFVRVRARNGDGISAPSPEVGLVFGGGCSAPPLPPDPKAVVSGTNVALSWQAAPGFVTNYKLLVGTQAGISNILTTDVGGITALGAAAGPGTYHVRVVAEGICGASAPSGDLPVVIGGAAPPLMPTVQSQVTGSTVTVTWDAVAGAAGYRLVAGTAPLLANITAFDTTGTALVAPGVPPGVYWVRVYAIGAGGPSAPSREMMIVVP